MENKPNFDQISDAFQVEIMTIMECREKIDTSLKKMILLFQQVQDLQKQLYMTENHKE